MTRAASAARTTLSARASLAVAWAVAVGLGATLAGAPPAGAAAGLSASFTWPEFHNSPGLLGVSPDPGISTANAAGLGVKWMAPVGASLDSPVAAVNATLGRTVLYEGDKAGYVNAVDASSGQIVWSVNLGASITSSPLVDRNGNIWVAPVSGGKIYKLNGATGATVCTAPVDGSVQGTPVLATPPGGVPTLFVGTLGPLDAINAVTCAPIFSFAKYHQQGGSWDPISYGVDRNGRPLVVFGTADPDDSVYALDAVTGALDWRFQTYSVPGTDWDVGAGVTVSPPGTNGLADGAAYVDSKDGVFYAIDLTTGAQLWSYNFGGNGPGQPINNTDALSTPALAGRELVFGDDVGEYALDAVTGAVDWYFNSGGDYVNSSAAVVGPAGSRVAAFGTLDGRLDVLDLTTGSLLYQYQTGSFVTSSPADVNGTLAVASADGYLYDFGPGGGNGATPATAVTAPATGSVLPHPSGPVTISGTASSTHGVGAVEVWVQENGADGPWYHPAAGAFAPGLAEATATLASPGSAQTTWSLALPVPPQGGSYQVFASAVDTDGIADVTAESTSPGGASDTFSVSAGPGVPVVTSPQPRVAPGTSLEVAGSGFGPSEQVTFTLPVSASTTLTLGTVTSTRSGNVPASSLPVPGSVPFGPGLVSATGQTSGKVGQLAVYVANDDPQLGDGPQRTGSEPHDLVLAQSQSVGHQPLEQLAWKVDTGGPVDTTPAIVQGVAYVGDQAGNLYAVTTSSGTVVWSTNLGSAVESSPAVDSGLVMVGDDAGAVVARRVATGQPAWTASLGGPVLGAPAVAGGDVYAVSSAGQVASLRETNGHAVWQVSLGAAAAGSVALDPAAGLVVVGDGAGTLHALNSANGSVAWTATLGAPVAGNPIIAGGTVYAETTGGTLYALGEATGTTQWSFAAGSAVAAAPVVAGGNVFVGAGNGQVDVLTTGGTLQLVQAFGHPVTGMAASAGILVLGSSDGTAGLFREPAGVRVAWHAGGSDTPLASPPVLVNGDVYVAGGTALEAYSPPGTPVI
jgi:outer membrane protein assembly factor BamB